LIYFQGGTPLNQAVIAGDVQLELIAAGPALSANLAGADLVFIQGNVNTFPSRLCSPVPSTPPS